MADGCRIEKEKSLYLRNGMADFDEIQQLDANWPFKLFQSLTIQEGGGRHF